MFWQVRVDGYVESLLANQISLAHVYNTYLELLRLSSSLYVVQEVGLDRVKLSRQGAWRMVWVKVLSHAKFPVWVSETNLALNPVAHRFKSC